MSRQAAAVAVTISRWIFCYDAAWQIPPISATIKSWRCGSCPGLPEQTGTQSRGSPSRRVFLCLFRGAGARLDLYGLATGRVPSDFASGNQTCQGRAGLRRQLGGCRNRADTRGPVERGSKSFLTEVQSSPAARWSRRSLGGWRNPGSCPAYRQRPGRLRATHAQHRNSRRHPSSAIARRGTATAVPGSTGEYTDRYLPERLAATYQKSTDTAATSCATRCRPWTERWWAKRQESRNFRSGNDIISAERDENQLLSAAKVLATGLNEARASSLRPRESCARYGMPPRRASRWSLPRTTRRSRILEQRARSCASSCTMSSKGSRRNIWIWTRR